MSGVSQASQQPDVVQESRAPAPPMRCATGNRDRVLETIGRQDLAGLDAQPGEVVVPVEKSVEKTVVNPGEAGRDANEAVAEVADHSTVDSEHLAVDHEARGAPLGKLHHAAVVGEQVDVPLRSGIDVRLKVEASARG